MIRKSKRSGSVPDGVSAGSYPVHLLSVLKKIRDLGQLQIILAAAGLLSVLATVSCTLFLSAKCKDTLTVLLISIVVLLMPLFAYVAMGATWLSTILPSAGIGMQNNFLSQLANFNYLNIGGMSFWTPHVILISAGIELFVFTFLAIHSYCRHQVA